MNKCVMTMCSKELIQFNKLTDKVIKELAKLKVKLDKAKAESNDVKSKKVEKKMTQVPVKLRTSKEGRKIRRCIDTAMEKCNRKVS